MLMLMLVLVLMLMLMLMLMLARTDQCHLQILKMTKDWQRDLRRAGG